MLAFLICLFGAIFLFIQSIKFEKQKVINYEEKSYVDFQVCLENNEFYETECLSKDTGIYVAKLINNIPITFDYDFNIEQNSNISFSYSVIGKLIISNSKEGKVYFEKDYIIIPEKTETISSNKYHLSQGVNINYNAYNNLANSFKESYNLDAVSSLKIYMKISKYNSNYSSLSDDQEMYALIPLSEKAIDIKIDSESINDSNFIINGQSISLSDKTSISIAIALLSLSIYFLIIFIKILFQNIINQSAYDKYINGIFKDFDSIIAETDTAPDYNCNIINVNKFSELLDVYDNIKLPILHYIVSPHNESDFYIKYDEDIYLYIIKAKDIKEKANKKRNL